MNKRLVYTKSGLEIQFAQDKVIIIEMIEVRSKTDEPSEKQGAKTAARLMKINVVGPDGKPVAGAKIHAAIWSKEKTAKTNQTYVSDARGETAIELPKTFDILRLFTRCDGYVPLFTHWEQLDENPPATFTINLTTGTLIGGIVKNEEGQAVAGAKVEVLLSQDHSEQLKQTSNCTWLAEGDDARFTDAAGRWTLDNVPAGEVKLLLKISHPDYVGDKEWGDLQKEQKVTLEDLRKQTDVITLHREK